jgi:hypothetical protein
MHYFALRTRALPKNTSGSNTMNIKKQGTTETVDITDITM